MTRREFEALLKLQGLFLLMCDVRFGVHTDEQKLFAADVVTEDYTVVTEGVPAKTPAGAIQRTIARHYKKHANH